MIKNEYDQSPLTVPVGDDQTMIFAIPDQEILRNITENKNNDLKIQSGITTDMIDGSGKLEYFTE